MTAADFRERAAALHTAGIDANAEMRPRVAVRRLREALEILGRPDPDDVATSTLRGQILVSLALSESEQGHIQAGLDLLDEAEPLLSPPARGALHGQRGILLRRTGRDRFAADAYGTALSLLDPKRQAEDVAAVRLNRSVMHLAAVHLGPAREDLRACLTLAEARGFSLLRAKARHNLGYLDFLAGDLPAALRAYSNVAVEYAELAPGTLAVLSLDRARALLAAGLYTDADRELQHVVRQLGGQRLSQDLAEAHLARAEAALLADRPTAARRHAARARAGFERRDNPRWAARAELLGLRAEQLAGKRAYGVREEADRARDRLESLGLAEDARVAATVAARATLATQGVGVADEAADRLRRAVPRRADRLDTRLLWRLASAEVAAARGDGAGARRHRSKGLAALQDQRSRVGSVDLRTGTTVHGRALATAGLDSAIRSGRISEIFMWSERARAQTLLLPPIRPPADPAVAAWVAELRGVQSALAQREMDGSPLAALRARRDKLERSLREHAWFTTGPAGAARRIGIGRIRAELGDAAMVVQLPVGRRLAVLVLAGGRACVLDLGAAAPILAAVRRLRADLDVGAGRRLPVRVATTVAEATRRDADTVARCLLEPVLAMVGDRDLVMVPTGALVTVPWPVLAPTRGRPLTVALSATSWSLARSRVLPGLDPSTRALLAAGPRIARGDQEVAALARRLPESAVLTGPAATVDATLAGLSQSDVAHLAAHGHHAADNALFSGLELNDGLLMGYDVHAVDRVPALVVLSACDVGRHDVRPGDESLGMATALLGAGAGTVIAAVCRVADDAAPDVMESMYSALLAGHPPATALAAADANPGFVCFGA
ncbi:MAG TPA: CHAT domain-containing protein [Nocardioidaceae bacterium]|nr:CHAT domain-containing protein [Nocardioidaceae bacterium]